MSGLRLIGCRRALRGQAPAMSSQPPLPEIPNPAMINDRRALAEVLRALKDPRSYADLLAGANMLMTQVRQGRADLSGWGSETPSILAKGTVTDWYSGRSLPSPGKLFTYLTVCEVPSDSFPGWQEALSRVRSLPAVMLPDPDETEQPSTSEPTTTIPDGDSPAVTAPSESPSVSPDSPRHHGFLVPALIGVLVVVLVLVGIIVIPRSSPQPGPLPSPLPAGTTAATPAAPTATTDNAPGLSTGVPSGRATVQVVFDVPGGCSTSYTVTGDVNGDPRASGATLWIVTQLAADPENGSPNALYYARQPVPAVNNGHFMVTIAANTAAGSRTGRVLLVASPNASAAADLQLSATSGDIDPTRYPDGRRIRLQEGNTEIATSPFTQQRC